MNTCYEEYEVYSFDEFLKIIFDIKEKIYGKDTELWFRGEDRDYGEEALTPTIFRKNFFKKLGCKDDEIIFFQNNKKQNLKLQITLDCFRRFNIFFKEIFNLIWFYEKDFEYAKDNLEYLALLRHYGITSEILDFSRSPYVALFFSLQGSLESEEDSFIYVVTPHLLNYQLSLGKYMGYILTGGDFNLLIRRFLKDLILEKNSYINPKEHPFLDILNPEILKRDLEMFFKKEGVSQSIAEKVFNFIFRDERINIEIYTTPVAVSFKYKHNYMESQKAVGILFGFSWLNTKSKYVQLLGFTNLCDYINFIKDNLKELGLINILPNPLLWRIKIVGNYKLEIFKQLLLYRGLNKFKIFGRDLRFIESIAITQIMSYVIGRNSLNNQELKKFLKNI